MSKVSRPLPTLAQWKEKISYDPVTGKFWWNFREGRAYWNSRFAGREAGCVHDRYTRISLDRRSFSAHRIAWLYITGEYPVGEIDHINGDHHDNRAVNLRDVTHSDNQRNAPLRSTNRSGVVGVYQIRSSGKWCAQIRDHDGVIKHLGNFDNLNDAAAARKSAERRYGYHPNHGRKAA
jgi:HNH endonuclease